jgi:hypothetical protein
MVVEIYPAVADHYVLIGRVVVEQALKLKLGIN